MKKLAIALYLLLIVFVPRPLYSGSILRAPVQSQLKNGDAVEATNQDTHRISRGTRLSKSLSVMGNLKPVNTEAQLSLERVIFCSQANAPQQVAGPSGGVGPWSGHYSGWKKRGYVWYIVICGGNTSLGGIAPVPGEVCREVRWAYGPATTVIVMINGGRTLILTGRVNVSGSVLTDGR